MINPEDVIWYSRSRGSIETGPNVSVNKAGRVVVNQEAMNLFDEVPEAMMVGIIPQARGKATLVLQAAKKGDVGALTITKQGKAKFSLNTSRFLKESGLEKHFGSASAKPEIDRNFNALVVTL